MTDRAARIGAGVLAVLGTLLLVVGIAAGFARYEVLDSARFAATADQLRKDPTGRQTIGDRGQRPCRRSQPVPLLAVAGSFRGGVRSAVRWAGVGLIGAAVLFALLVGAGGLFARSTTVTSVATAALKAGWAQFAPTMWILTGILAVAGVVLTAASHLRKHANTVR